GFAADMAVQSRLGILPERRSDVDLSDPVASVPVRTRLSSCRLDRGSSREVDMSNTAIFGIYPTRESVEAAGGELQAAGFRNTDVSVLVPQNVGTKDLAHSKATKAPEGAATGAGSGAVIGGALGWLAGIGAIAIPNIGPFLAGGPIVAALAGIG